MWLDKSSITIFFFTSEARVDYAHPENIFIKGEYYLLKVINHLNIATESVFIIRVFYRIIIMQIFIFKAHYNISCQQNMIQQYLAS